MRSGTLYGDTSLKYTGYEVKNRTANGFPAKEGE